jgi:hypothetical protein
MIALKFLLASFSDEENFSLYVLSYFLIYLQIKFIILSFNEDPEKYKTIKNKNRVSKIT